MSDHVLTVRGTMNIGESSLAQFSTDSTPDIDEIANSTVMHERVSTEHKWMIVDRRDCSTGSCTNVAETDTSFCIGANGTEVHIIQGRLYCFVECRSKALVRC